METGKSLRKTGIYQFPFQLLSWIMHESRLPQIRGAGDEAVVFIIKFTLWTLRTQIFAEKTKMLFLFWLSAKNKKLFPICAGAQNENLLPFTIFYLQVFNNVTIYNLHFTLYYIYRHFL